MARSPVLPFLALLGAATLAAGAARGAVIIAPPPDPEFPVATHELKPRIEELARMGQATGVGEDRFEGFGAPLIDARGDVAFGARVAPYGVPRESALFRVGRGDAAPTPLLRSGDPASGGGTLGLLGHDLRWSGGEMLSVGGIDVDGDGLRDGLALLRTQETGTQEILRTGAPAPDGNGRISDIGEIALGPSGEATVLLTTEGSTAGVANDEVLLRVGGGLPERIVRDADLPVLQGDPRRSDELRHIGVAPDGGVYVQTTGLFREAGLFRVDGGVDGGFTRVDPVDPFSPAGSDGVLDPGGLASDAFSVGTGGSVAFVGLLADSGERVVLLRSGDAFHEIARAGDTAPDGSSTLGLVRDVLAVGSDRVAFGAPVSGDPFRDDQALFLGGTADGLVMLAREGDPAPGDGDHSIRGLSMDDVAASPSGNLLAFVARVSSATGGTDEALFLTDGTETVRLVEPTRFVTLAGGRNPGGRLAVNDRGQVAARVVGGSERIVRASPDLAFRGDGAASWETADHWTFGIAPGAENPVEIAATPGRVVAGPSEARSVHSLDLGAGDAGQASLDLAHDFTAATWIDVEERGTLRQSSGVLRAEILHVAGRYVQTGGSARTGELASAGTLEIDGALHVEGLARTRGDLVLGETARLTAERFVQHLGSSRLAGDLEAEEHLSLGGSAEQTGGLLSSRRVSVIGDFVQSAGRIEADDYRQNGTVTLAGRVETRSFQSRGAALVTETGSIHMDAGAFYEGVAVVNGRLEAATGVRVASGATLHGGGVIAASLLADRGSVVSAGDGVGTLFIEGDLETEPDARLVVDILLDDDGIASHDVLDVLGTADLDWMSTIELRFVTEDGSDAAASDFDAIAGRALDVLLAEEIALRTTFALGPEIAAPLPVHPDVVDLGGGRQALRLVMIPEPGTAGLLLAGLAVLAGRCRGSSRSR